jgi:hypothetical protein
MCLVFYAFRGQTYDWDVHRFLKKMTKIYISAPWMWTNITSQMWRTCRNLRNVENGLSGGGSSQPGNLPAWWGLETSWLCYSKLWPIQQMNSQFPLVINYPTTSLIDIGCIIISVTWYSLYGDEGNPWHPLVLFISCSCIHVELIWNLFHSIQLYAMYIYQHCSKICFSVLLNIESWPRT